MMEHKKLSLTEIFTHSPHLCEMIKKVNQLSNLNRLIQQKLEPQLAQQCRLANYRQNILILSAATPAIGHLLRFAVPDLLMQLRQEVEWCHLAGIQVEVRPPLIIALPVIAPHPAPVLSPNSAAQIKEAAFSIDNVSLKKALLRLSNRVTL
jgi:hypothetical protein